MKRKDFIVIACAFIGAFLFICINAPTVIHRLTPFRFSLGLSFGSGFTRIELPPVGSIEAKTHLAPLDLVLTLRNIDLDGLQQLLNNPDSKQYLINSFLLVKWKLILPFVLKMMGVSVLGGIFGGLWVKRDWHSVGYGLSCGISLVLIIGLAISITFNPGSLSNPTYNGALKAAPWALGLAQNAWRDWNDLGNSATIFVRNVRQVMAKANSDVLDKLDSDFKILHVSDIHNNPQAINFISEIENNFSPDIIIDTGDLTDYGTAMEDVFLKRLDSIQTPYYSILGNHDSPTIANKLSSMEKITLIDGLMKINGLNFMGFSDPGSATHVLTSATRDEIAAQIDALEKWLQLTDQTPFILATHNPDIGRPFMGRIPVILAGHTHVCHIEMDSGSVLVNAGTTGGAGVRGLLQENETALTAMLLYIDNAGTVPKLDAVDTIRLYPRENRFELKRSVIPG